MAYTLREVRVQWNLVADTLSALGEEGTEEAERWKTARARLVATILEEHGINVIQMTEMALLSLELKPKSAAAYEEYLRVWRGGK